jgi:predicted small lipoprotein YifL
MIRAALVLALLTLLPACGQKGALYLPDPEAQVVPPVAPAATPAVPGEADRSNESRKRIH